MAPLALPEPEVDPFFLSLFESATEESSDPAQEMDEEERVDYLDEILDELEEIDGEG